MQDVTLARHRATIKEETGGYREEGKRNKPIGALAECRAEPQLDTEPP